MIWYFGPSVFIGVFPTPPLIPPHTKPFSSAGIEREWNGIPSIKNRRGNVNHRMLK